MSPGSQTHVWWSSISVYCCWVVSIFKHWDRGALGEEFVAVGG